MAVDKRLKAGIAASRAGDKETAAALFSRVIQEDPRFAEGWFWLGKSVLQKEKRIYCFQRALKLDPAHFEAQLELEKLSKPKPLIPESKKNSVSPFSVEPEKVFTQEEPAEEETFLPETPSFLDWEEDDDEFKEEGIEEEPEEKKISGDKKRARVLIGILGALAFFSVVGVVAFFSAQPNFFVDLAAVIVPPTSTPTPTPTATASLVPTATPLPFDALSVGEYTPIFDATDCAFEIPQGAKVDCGYITLPEDRYGDVSDTIRLAIAIYHKSGDGNSPPLFYLQGGPGQNAIETLTENFDLAIAPFIENNNFIVLDQRGTGFSEPKLDCPALKTLYQEDSTKKIPFEKREDRYLTAFTECRNDLIAQGANLSAYNTIASAADVKDIVLALGYEKVTLFGVSYGTRLAQVVMREYPEIVHAAILDSVLPVEAKIYNQSAASSQEALDTLFAGCAADSACRSAYPNLEEDLRELVTRLDQEPMRTNILLHDENSYSRSVDGTAFMSAILWALRQPELIPTVPQAIARAKLDDTNIIGTILSYPSLGVMNVDLGAYLSINCREQVYASSPEEISEDLASYPDTEEVGLAWVYGDPNFIFSLCSAWQVEGLRPGENDALSSDIPALVMSGEYDSTTPPSFAEQVSARLSRATLIEFPGLGHAVAFTQVSSCPVEIVQNFLRDPNLLPDTSCLASMESPQFSTPYTGEPRLAMKKVADKELGVITTVPLEWETLGSGFYYRNKYIWDVTQVGAQQVRVSFDTWMAWLMDNFNGTGLDSYPIKTGEENINGLVWSLYATTAQGHPVDLAFAKSGYDTIMVAMMSHADERDEFFETVFLEMLNTTIVIPTK